MRAALNTLRQFRLWPRSAQRRDSAPKRPGRDDVLQKKTPRGARCDQSLASQPLRGAMTPPAARRSLRADATAPSSPVSPVPACDNPRRKHEVTGLTRLDMCVWGVVAFASVAMAIVPMLLATVGVAVVPLAACAASMLVALVLGGFFLMVRDARRRRVARQQTLERRPTLEAMPP